MAVNFYIIQDQYSTDRCGTTISMVFDIFDASFKDFWLLASIAKYWSGHKQGWSLPNYEIIQTNKPLSNLQYFLTLDKNVNIPFQSYLPNFRWTTILTKLESMIPQGCGGMNINVSNLL